MNNASLEVVKFPLKKGSFQVDVQQVPKRRGCMLTCYAKTIPGRGWRVRLEVPFLGILEASTDSSGLKLLKVTIFVNLDGQDPSTCNIVIDLMLSSVSILHRSKV